MNTSNAHPGSYHTNGNFGNIRGGARLGGIVIAFQCIVTLVFIAFGLSLMGAILTGIAYKKRSPPFDSEFFRKSDEGSPMRIIGPLFLGIGGFMLCLAFLICYIAYNTGKKLQTEYQPEAPILSGPQPPLQHQGPYSSQGPYPIVNPQQAAILPQNPQPAPYLPQQPYPGAPYSSQPAYSPESQVPPPSYYDSSKDILAYPNDALK